MRRASIARRLFKKYRGNKRNSERKYTGDKQIFIPKNAGVIIGSKV